MKDQISLRGLIVGQGIKPEALAIEFEELRTTYSELSLRIAAVADWLHEQGVASGDRVAWLGTNEPGRSACYSPVLG